jgi:hypothetical protein
MTATPRPPAPVPPSVPPTTPPANPLPYTAQGCWNKALDDSSPPVSWLWEGCLAPGTGTLLTSQSKSAKRPCSLSC